MDSMSSNLGASLPLNIEDDPELTDRFKDSALSITALFKHSQKSRKAGFAQGYNACVSDLRDYIRSNARSTEIDRPLTVGAILDFLESRQFQLLRDLDMPLPLGSSSTTQTAAPTASIEGNKPVQSVSSKSSSPPLHQQQSGAIVRSPSRQRSPTGKRQSPAGVTSMPLPQPHSPPRIAPWDSPSLSPPPLPEPAWPEVSVIPVLSTLTTAPVGLSTLSNVLPTVGVKRKRDALAELDPRISSNLINHNHHRHNGSKKKRGSVNKGLNQNRSFGTGNGNGAEEHNMDLDDETGPRDKKRVHKS